MENHSKHARPAAELRQTHKQQNRICQEPFASSSQQNVHQNPQQLFQSHHQQQISTNIQMSPYQPLGPARIYHGQYGTSSMTQALPMIDYRQLQYVPGTPGYASSSAPAVSHTISGQPVTFLQNYTAQHSAPNNVQAFYMAQRSVVASQQYYGNHFAAIHPTSPAVMPNLHGYGYFPNQAQTTTPYYYPQLHQHSQHSQHSKQQGVPDNYASTPYDMRESQPVVVAAKAELDGMRPLQGLAQHTRIGHDPVRTLSVRGPPRKPKQSGYAIWIGNLPSQTQLMSLVHHVCLHTVSLESLFLISKSNCAFANFPTEESCLAAQQNINDTWFMSVRLVSRLRNNTVEGTRGSSVSVFATQSTASLSQRRTHQSNADQTERPDCVKDATNEDIGGDLETSKSSSSGSSLIVDGTGKSISRSAGIHEDETLSTPRSGLKEGARVERFFILKSLTLEDLELSVQTGIWATQPHNEELLNSAFKSCDGVYLIFSANKSGEYFGYAKMISEINNDPAAAIEFAPMSQFSDENDLPKAILTDPKGDTPRGRIIDDSARGTMFWEILTDDGSVDGQTGGGMGDGIDGGGEDNEAKNAMDGADREDRVDRVNGADAMDRAGGIEAKACGKPFKLGWISTTRLPFCRTRGMRNPLNANREIKVARDGTEVDASVGRKLVNLFHQAAVSPAAGDGGRATIPMVAGYGCPAGSRTT